MTCCNMKHFLKNIVFLYAIVSSIKAGPDSASTSGITRPTPIQAKVGGGGNFDNSRSVIPTVNTAITITTSGGNTPPGPIQIVNKPACICIGDNGYKEKKHNAIFAIRLGKTGIGITLFGWKFGINIGGNEGNNHAIGINYGGKGGNNNSIGINFGGDVGNFNDIGVNIGQKGGNHLFYLGINLGPSYGTYGVGIDLGKLFKTGGSSTSTGGGGTTTHGSGGTVIFRIRLGKGGIGITIFNHEIGINFGGAKGTHGAIGINFGGTGGNVKPIGLNFGQTGGNQEGVGINVGGTGGNRGKYVGIQLGKTDGAGGIGIDFGKLLGADGKGGIFGSIKRKIQSATKYFKKVYHNFMLNFQYTFESIKNRIFIIPSAVWQAGLRIVVAIPKFIIQVPGRIINLPSFVIHIPGGVINSTFKIISQIIQLIIEFPKRILILLRYIPQNTNTLLIGNTGPIQLNYNFNKHVHYVLSAATNTAWAVDIDNDILYLANGNNGEGFIFEFTKDNGVHIAAGSSKLTWNKADESWAKYFRTKDSLKNLFQEGVAYEMFKPSAELQNNQNIIIQPFILEHRVRYSTYPIIFATTFATLLTNALHGSLKDLHEVSHGPITLGGDLIQTENTYFALERIFQSVPYTLHSLSKKGFKLNIKKLLSAPCGINVLSYLLKVFKYIDSAKVFNQSFDTEQHFYDMVNSVGGRVNYYGFAAFITFVGAVTDTVVVNAAISKVRNTLRVYLDSITANDPDIEANWKFAIDEFYSIFRKRKLDTKFIELSKMLKGLNEENLVIKNIHISKIIKMVYKIKEPVTRAQRENLVKEVMNEMEPK